MGPIVRKKLPLSKLICSIVGSVQKVVCGSTGPVPRERDWLMHVARPQTDVELVALRRSAERGAPYGSERWQKRVTGQMGLESTLRPRGGPRKRPNNEA